MLIHDLQQVPGAHGGDAQRAVGSDDFRLYIAACCMGAVGKEKAHGAVFALDHGGGIVCVMQFPTEVELKDTTDGPDVTDVRAGEPADQIQIVDAHVQELAARVGRNFSVDSMVLRGSWVQERTSTTLPISPASTRRLASA